MNDTITAMVNAIRLLTDDDLLDEIEEVGDLTPRISTPLDREYLARLEAELDERTKP